MKTLILMISLLLISMPSWANDKISAREAVYLVASCVVITEKHNDQETSDWWYEFIVLDYGPVLAKEVVAAVEPLVEFNLKVLPHEDFLEAVDFCIAARAAVEKEERPR